MTKPIYANEQHRQAVETYILMCTEFAKEVSTKSRYNNYLEVLQIVLEYHNNYGKGLKENNYWDWLMIIPINLSVMTNGFFAGAETKGNTNKVRAYRVLLAEMLAELVEKIEKLEPEND
jgi:hypothetical protein